MTDNKPSDDSERAQVEELVLERLREVFSANPWIVATEYVQGAARLGQTVASLTDTPVMVVGAGANVGPVDDSNPVICLEVPAAESMVATMHRGQRALADPPAEYQAKIDSWDPEHLARSIASFTGVAGDVMGRATFGSRPERWRELEDKLLIEALWASAGIPVAPSRQVDLADLDAVLAAHDELATEAGTVWAGDNSSGWHGGGDGTVWVPDREAAESLAGTLDRFQRVRVMPFLEGIPCSMHGMVVPDGVGGTDVLTFRPCEMIVLRDRKYHRFVYGRSATFWDPAPADRETMKDTARRIGRELVNAVDYRGIFTVDGVMAADGFVPTEVNTRYGAALPSIHKTVGGDIVDLWMLNLLLVERRFEDCDLRPLGSIITEELDRNRTGRAFINGPVAPETECSVRVSLAKDGTLVVTERFGDEPPENEDQPESESAETQSEDQTVATVELGSTDGESSFAILTFEHVAVGTSAAPVLVEVIEALNNHLGLGISPLEPAKPVR